MTSKVWVVAVSMGYGHQRTAHPLRHLAPKGKIINANDYRGIPAADKKIWQRSKVFYEFISRIKRLPFVGQVAFEVFDKFQEILNYYPKEDLSRPNIQLKQIYSLIKKGWGRHLIENLKSQNGKLPIITTFFVPAFMAEFFNYPGEIFCVVCDADISRAWAPLSPHGGKIKYLAPNERTAKRLRLYGVRAKNIFLTGYPLPLENIGGQKAEISKKDLKLRLLNLDPKNKYRGKYKILIDKILGSLPKKSGRPLTLMFAVGGAGAQKEIGLQIVRRLTAKILAGEARVLLAAGIRGEVMKYFEENLDKLKLKSPDVEIIFGKDIKDYFQKFNRALRKTDILWTKPSELSFYSALGLPIIIAPPIGSQEEFNMRWLLKSGFGNFQENPKYVNQWLFDWLEQGYLAESAMEAFIEGERMGVFNIQKIIKECPGY